MVVGCYGWTDFMHSTYLRDGAFFFKHKENVLPGFAITFQSVLQNCEIDYPVDLTGALNKAQGHLNSLLSSPC